jgi:uncharacterized membrane protein HdeD (DUF308 family)
MTEAQQDDPVVEIEGILNSLASYWTIFVLRGLVILFFGALFLVFPETSVATFSIIFGVFCILDGVSCFIKMWLVYMFVEGGRVPLTMLYFLSSASNLILGIFAIAYPNLTAQILLVFVGVWFVLIGFLELLLLCLMRGDPIMSGGGSGCMFLGGAMYFIFGIVLLSDLERGVERLAKLVGVIVMLFAFQMIFFGLRLRKVHKSGASSTDGANAPLYPDTPTNPTSSVV